MEAVTVPQTSPSLVSSSPRLVAEAALLIRRPVTEVFQAFLDPGIASRFWFSRSSGELREGSTVTWSWDPADCDVAVDVLAVRTGELIAFDWNAYGEFSRVEIQFEAVAANQTWVRASCRGLGQEPGATRAAADFSESFALVLAGLKALLEHHVVLNLIADRCPPVAAEQPA